MKCRWCITAAVVFSLVIISVSALSKQPSGKGHGQQAAAAEEAGKVKPAGSLFSLHEQGLINGWFKSHSSSLPPGLAKREKLPPGLDKQLRRNGTLPPGLQKKMQPFPLELDKQLGPLPEGCRRVIVGDRAVILNSTTSKILDIMSVILR
jgi:hypothetical protein